MPIERCPLALTLNRTLLLEQPASKEVWLGSSAAVPSGVLAAAQSSLGRAAALGDSGAPRAEGQIGAPQRSDEASHCPLAIGAVAAAGPAPWLCDGVSSECATAYAPRRTLEATSYKV